MLRLCKVDRGVGWMGEGIEGLRVWFSYAYEVIRRIEKVAS